MVLASWHQRLYGGIEPFRRFAPVMLISLSRDGAAAARVAERLGYAAIRGSSSRGAGSALVAIMQSVAEGRVAAHLVDGPRGPARRTKPGVVRIAQRARASIVPIYVAYARAWEARSWDRFQVPLPFTRVLVRAGPAIEVPVELERADRDELCARLDREFAAGFARADADVRRVPAPGGDARSQQSTCNTSR